jgi:diguanylate cyclase (GGDEF)-like protein
MIGNDRTAVEVQCSELLLEWGMRLEHIGYAEDARPRFERAAELARAAMERTTTDADEGNTKAGLAQACMALSLAKTGESAAAAKVAAELVVATRRSGQLHEARWGHMAYGLALRDLGDLAGARRELLAGRELAQAATSHAVPLLFEFELASLAAAQHGGAASDALSALRRFARAMWQSRLERITMLRQARARAELEAARARADEAALRDPLTGLGNRRRFEQQMSVLGQPSDIHPPVTLALVDADGFKAVNDGHSHAVGDTVLRHIAEILRANCRENDVAVRFGGDEFAIFFTADMATASQIAERVREAVAERDWSDVGDGISVTLSIGLAQFLPGMSPRELFDVADHQLYAAKHGGRNRLAAAA